MLVSGSLNVNGTSNYLGPVNFSGTVLAAGSNTISTTASFTGAVALSPVVTLQKLGNNLNITIAAITATSTAAGNLTAAAVLPVGWRPSLNATIPCVVTNNALASVLGQIIVDTTGGFTLVPYVVSGTALVPGTFTKTTTVGWSSPIKIVVGLT
jgi:hypothetical protein